MGKCLNKRMAKQWAHGVEQLQVDQPHRPTADDDEPAWPPKSADDHAARRDEDVLMPLTKFPRR